MIERNSQKRASGKPLKSILIDEATHGLFREYCEENQRKIGASVEVVLIREVKEKGSEGLRQKAEALA